MRYFITAWVAGWVSVSVYWFRLSLISYRRSHRSHTLLPEHRVGFIRSYILSVLLLSVWWPAPTLFAAYDRVYFWWRQRRE